MVIVGVYFGTFQALMPIIGYLLGIGFQDFVTKYDHWIAFILLGMIGFNMVKESFEDNEQTNDLFTFKVMLPLAVATSIDALAIGITFAFLKVNIMFSALAIGITTFVLSALGSKIGNVFGKKYKNKAEFIGGLILIIMGLKILLEHLNIIG